MNPITKTPTAPQPIVNDVAAPPPMPAPSLVDNFPVHTQGQAPVHHDPDAELDKIMQDVGQVLRKDDNPHQKHHFWEPSRHHKKEANFSTQKSIQHAAQPAAKPQSVPVSHPPTPKTPAQTVHTRVKPAAQKPSKPPKPPKQHNAPVLVTILTTLVTSGLIAVAYHAYK